MHECKCNTIHSTRASNNCFYFRFHCVFCCAQVEKYDYRTIIRNDGDFTAAEIIAEMT